MPPASSQHGGAIAAGSHRTDAIVVLDAPRLCLYRSERKWMRWWLLSQNGLVALAPQRHSLACVTRAMTRPVPLTISRLPAISRGPSTSGSIASVPAQLGSGSADVVGGSPVAAKFIAACELSQNGLL